MSKESAEAEMNATECAQPACCRSKQQTTTVPRGGSRFGGSPGWWSRGLAVLASLLLLVSLKLPLWRMHLEAPQYRDREALNIAVHPDRFQGDLKELTVLDQYIGVHVPARLPQFKWLPALLAGGAGLGILTVFLPGAWRRRGLVIVACALAAGLALAAAQATTQIRDIGHKRDTKTILAGIKDFTPPFLGTSKIAQFTVSSTFGAGAWLIGAALLLQLGAARLSVRSRASQAPLNRNAIDAALMANPSPGISR